MPCFSASARVEAKPAVSAKSSPVAPVAEIQTSRLKHQDIYFLKLRYFESGDFFCVWPRWISVPEDSMLVQQAHWKPWCCRVLAAVLNEF